MVFSMTKVVKKKNTRLKKQIRKTLGALFMISAIVVAAIPTTEVSAKPEDTASKVWIWDGVNPKWASLKPDTSIQPYCKNTIPYVFEMDENGADAIIYTSGDGRFQFAYVAPTKGNSNKVAVILNYNSGVIHDSTLEIPNSMEAFRKYKTTSSEGYYCLVTKSDEFMFYDVYEQDTDEYDRKLYKVPDLKYDDDKHKVPTGDTKHSIGDSYEVQEDQLFERNGKKVYIEKGLDEEGNEIELIYDVTPSMVTHQKPCYYEQRSLWGDSDDMSLYYQVKDSVTVDKPNGDLVHPTDESHYRIDASVKYIGQEKIQDVSGEWKLVTGDYRDEPNEGVFANIANITNLVINENLSGISDYAFQGCATLESVTLANGLETIGNGAFANCIRLSQFNMAYNANIQALGKDAFYNCTALGSISIPINVRAIGDYCFEGCTRLNSIDLCNGEDADTMLRTIGSYAFKDCSSLGSLTFPTNYNETDLPISTVQGCTSLLYIKVTNTLMDFADDTTYTFEDFKNEVPESFYFWGPDTKTDGTSKSAIHQTANDEEIAFKYWDQELYEVVIAEDADNKITYQVNDRNELVKVWKIGSPVNVVIPKKIGPYGIETIGKGSFNDICTIKKVTIPETVHFIGDEAFKGCHNLASVVFENSSTIQSIGTDAFRTQVATCGDKITTRTPELKFVGAMINESGNDTVPFIYAMTPENMINNPDQDKSWITCHSGFPTNMEVKYVYDFTTDTGSAQMQSYPRYEYYGNDTKLNAWLDTLPYVDSTNKTEYFDTIKEAFTRYNAKDPSNPPSQKQLEIINAALNVVVPTNVDSLKPGLFSGYQANEDGEAEAISGMGPDTEINSILLNGVNEIEPFTFTGCTNLKNVSVIGAEKVDDYAFGSVESIGSDGRVTSTDGCTNLEQVTLGSNISEIGKRPFRGCSKLDTITCLGDNLSYQNGVLYQHSGSDKILIECLDGRGDVIGSYTVGPEELSGVTRLQEEAFMNCDTIGKVDLSQTTIDTVPERTFYDAEDLNTVILPDTVKNIEAGSFQNCGMRVLTIPGNQSYIEKDAFLNKAGQQKIAFQCVKGTTADRYAKAYDYITPEYGKVFVEHTVYFWDYTDYPDTTNKTLFYKVKVKDGEDAVPPTDTPTHEGYMFTGWTDYTNISKDTDVWPRFGSDIFKVEFLDWDGTVITQDGYINPQYVEEGKSATPPPTDPTREGYTFTGWTPDYHNVTKDLTVIAKYTDNSGDQSRHTVTFYAYENGSMKAISVQKVNHGEAAVAPAVPARDGYTFTGWYPDKTVFSKVTTDLSIVASYDKNSANPTSNPSGATPTPTSSNGSGANGDNAKKYTVSVSGGSGSGSYPAGAIVALNAYDMGTGKNFDRWTTSTAGVGFANAEATSTTFTMPAANVAITATYKTGNGTNSSNGGTAGNTGSNTTGGGTSGGNTSGGSTSNGGTSVEVTKPGISNTNLAGATVSGSTDNFIVKVTEDQTASDMAVQALQAEFGDISRIKYLPMDISLYDSTGRIKIADTSGISVNITLPLPDDLAQYAGNNKVASVAGGVLDNLNTRFTTVDGVPCVNFTATHFSPYVIYVDTAHLTESTIDVTPKTGDPIHPKWFLAIGLASISLVLFFKRDKKTIKPKTA